LTRWEGLGRGRLLHLSVVETVPGGASLYGRSVRGDHVAALVKGPGAGGVLSVDIKAGHAALASSLVAALQSHF
jgi:hypothetical protein